MQTAHEPQQGPSPAVNGHVHFHEHDGKRHAHWHEHRPENRMKPLHVFEDGRAWNYILPRTAPGPHEHSSATR